MELLIKITTSEAMTLEEAKELERQSRDRRVTPGELAAVFIREGLRRALAAREHGRKEEGR